ncbi:hypothetical protein [Homoserinibacter sp. YIM 151385]|uniref:hypothetical protein n=1 Tax=Homoserinibacter sp. YIM 151385 TaxID=2985506 RepID=UPI0022F0AF95|nr:hypothetical protein [Homoserinibacter sp. YIM 151385]WBU37271.1 hypothetical protein OF852_10135 [Homoserinibacter sp. YIM 151385]
MAEDGGPLLVRGGGHLGVSTDRMLQCADRLAEVEDRLDERVRRLIAVVVELDEASTRSAAAASAMAVPAPEPTALEAEHRTAAARDAAAELRTRLAAAARAYEDAEEGLIGTSGGLVGLLSLMLGPSVRLLLPVLIAGAVGATAADRILGWLAGGDDDRPALAAVGRFIGEHPELLSNPLFAELVGIARGGVDEAIAGLLMPGGGREAMLALSLLGLGPAASGAIVLGAARAVGLLRDSPVSIERGRTGAATPAIGMRERLERVPASGDQVRIERYTAPGEPERFVVYVAPTRTFSPELTSEPWDLASNVGGVAGEPAASLRATELAMAEAGIGADDEVTMIGFSQGGLVAAHIAASPGWNVTGLETAGAPIGGIPLDGDLAGVSIEHREDFVPKLAGEPVAEGRTLVQRELFAGRSPAADEPVPGHQITGYLETAGAVDRAGSAAVRDRVDGIDDALARYSPERGGTVEAVTYRAERLVDERDVVLSPRSAPATPWSTGSPDGP